MWVNPIENRKEELVILDCNNIDRFTSVSLEWRCIDKAEVKPGKFVIG